MVGDLITGMHYMVLFAIILTNPTARQSSSLAFPRLRSAIRVRISPPRLHRFLWNMALTTRLVTSLLITLGIWVLRWTSLERSLASTAVRVGHGALDILLILSARRFCSATTPRRLRRF